MKRVYRSAIAKLRRASVFGAPYTSPGHVMHATLCEMARLGIVCGRRVGHKTFWSEL